MIQAFKKLDKKHENRTKLKWSIILSCIRVNQQTTLTLDKTKFFIFQRFMEQFGLFSWIKEEGLCSITWGISNKTRSYQNVNPTCIFSIFGFCAAETFLTDKLLISTISSQSVSCYITYLLETVWASNTWWL